MELQSPGLGLPGVLSVVGFSLFFGSRMVLGLSDWIDIVLVVIGVALLAVEMFVLPGFGVAGLLGILFAGAGLVLSFTLNDFEIPQYSWQWARWQDAVLTLGLTVVLTLTGVLLLARFLKYTPAYGRLVLADAQTEDQGYIVQSQEDEQGIGQMGVATTVLRPTGKARFGDRTMQVVSRADYIEKGEAVVVVEVEGNRYVVDRVAPDAMAGE
jgi:membrane-bound serine protease (ClpP class)